MANISLVLKRSLVTIRPHVPLIQFRKGGRDGSHQTTAKSATPAGGSGGRKGSGSSSSGVILEDYQLPLKYRRQPIDEKEIEAINNGGAF